MPTDSTRALAHNLVTACRDNTAPDKIDAFYHEDASSVEAVAGPGLDSPVSQGREAIKGKHVWWSENFEFHSGSIDGPFFHGDEEFAVIFEIDATMKQTGERSQMREVGVYTVKGDKIIREQFYYDF